MALNIYYKISTTVFFAVVFAWFDQATKHWVLQHYSLQNPVKYLSFFNVNVAYNHGAAFSFLQNASGWQNILFVVIAMVISVFLLQQLFKQYVWITAVASSCLLGGAWGNVIDRLYLGYVVDFIQLHYQQWYFPTFNIADSFITVGAIIWLWGHWRYESYTG